MGNITPKKVNSLLAGLRSIFIISLLIVVSCLFNVNPALAHRPHAVVHKLELSPNYEQDKTVFIFARDNVFKSSEDGKNWQRLTKGLDIRHKLADLAIFPKDKNILFLASEGDGIYKSTDNGNSWLKVNQGLDNLAIRKLAISPVSSDLVFAAGQEKELYRTTDGGKSWAKVFDPKITAIAFFPKENNKLIIGDKDGNLYRSEDEGKTWQKFNTIGNSGAITVLALSPKFESDNTLFVGTELGGIYKTSDQGKTFTPVNQGISDLNVRDIQLSKNYPQDSSLFAITWSEAVFESKDGGKTWKQYNKGIVKDEQADEPQFKEPHFNDLRIANNTMFLGTFNSLFKSIDGGHTWERLDTLSPGTIVALAVSPNYANDSTVILVNYVAMPYISRDKGVTWKIANKGLELPRLLSNFRPVDSEHDPRRFFSVKFSPDYGKDKTIFAGLLWNKLIKTTNGGDFWNIITLSDSVRGISVVPSPNFAADKTVYVANQYRIIFKSTDGGNNFVNIAKIGSRFSNESPSLVISPNFAEDKTLYINGEKGILKSVDGGKTWKSVTQGTPIMETGFIQLAISPNYKADQTVIAATNYGVFRTQDGGKTWAKFTNTAYGDDSYIEGVAISPDYQNDKTFIISVRGKGLYKTTDDGQKFSPIGNNSIAFAKMTYVPSSGIPIQFSPNYANDKTIFGFGAADTTVYRSTDGGNTWEAFTVAISETKNEYSPLTYISVVFDLYSNKIISVAILVISAIFIYLGFRKSEHPSRSYLIDIGFVLLLIAATLVINLRMIQNGLNGLGDLRWHLTWVQHFSKQLAEGIWYPRWMAGINFGYGGATFVFYPPLPHYIGSFIKLMGFNIEETMTILFSLGVFLSGLTMYIYGREKWGKIPALVAALFYMTSPGMIIHLNGGVLGNLFALPWIPLGLYLTDKALNNLRWGIPLAIQWFLIAITHTPSLLLYAIAWFLYTIFFFLKRPPKAVIGVLISAGIGLGMASCYLLPAILEQSFVNIDYPRFSKEGFQYTLKVADLFKQRFSDPLFGSQFIATLVMGGISIFCIRQDRAKIKETALWMGFVFFIGFMMSDWSAIIWQSSRVLLTLEFSWRFSGLFYFGEAALCGLALSNIFRLRLHFRLFFALILASIILMNFKFGYGEMRKSPGLHTAGAGKVFVREWMETAIIDPYSDTLIDVPEFRPVLDNSIPEFYPREGFTQSGLPKVDNPKPNPNQEVIREKGQYSLLENGQYKGRSPLPTPEIGQPKFSVVKGQAEIKLEKWASYQRQLKINVQETAIIRLRLYYYPAWHLYVNNQPYTFEKAEDGTIQFQLEPGDYNVEIRYQWTPAFTVGVILSLLSLTVLIGLAIAIFKMDLLKQLKID